MVRSSWVRSSWARSRAAPSFTEEPLAFDPIKPFTNVGNLTDLRGKYLIIDGQHRLAVLHFYRRQHLEDAGTIHVPCVIFDGKSEGFATEMFVIINSTPTRINKSHLVDLYEKVSWAGAGQEVRGARGRSPTCTARPTARCATRSTGWAAAASRRSGSSRPSCSTRSTAGRPATGRRSRRSRAGSARPSATTSELARAAGIERRGKIGDED